ERQARSLHDALPISKPKKAIISRIDKNQANARVEWEEMGSPTYLTASQLDRLQDASRLVWERLSFKWSDRTLLLEIDLPPHAVRSEEHTSELQSRSE